MTSGDMLSFAVHSPSIFRSLGVPDGDAAFQCWLTHLDYFTICLQHQITEAEVIELDRLVQSHHAQLRSIPSYAGIWKPKNHFACHFALNIRRFGPPRHYWCMRFEALNQVFKKIAVSGSYRDTTGRCADFFTIRAARLRKSGTQDDWGETRAHGETGVMTYLRENLEALRPVRWLFDHMYGMVPQLSLSWIASLYHEGVDLLAGLSWVLIQLEGTTDQDSPFFGYIVPNYGIFSMSGQHSLFLAIYPTCATRSGGEYSCSWSESYNPPTFVVPLLQLKSLTALWPVSEQVDGEMITRHFVRY